MENPSVLSLRAWHGNSAREGATLEERQTLPLGRGRWRDPPPLHCYRPSPLLFMQPFQRLCHQPGLPFIPHLMWRNWTHGWRSADVCAHNFLPPGPRVQGKGHLWVCFYPCQWPALVLKILAKKSQWLLFSWISHIIGQLQPEFPLPLTMTLDKSLSWPES